MDIDQIVKIISIETTIHNQIQTEEIFHLIPVPIQFLGIDTIQTIDHENHPTIETGTIPTIGIEAIQIIEISVIRTIDQKFSHTTDPIIKDPIIITIKIDHKIIDKIEIQTIIINIEIIPNPLIGIITGTPILKTSIEATQPNFIDKLFKYKQLKKQLQTHPPPPSIDYTKSTKIQLHNINCESTDSESNTDNAISVNMITVKNDFEPIIYEQPFNSHIYKNQLGLLHDYYTRPISNSIPVIQEANEDNTLIKPKKDEIQCSSTNHVFQNIQKNYLKKKFKQFHSLRSPKNKNSNHQTLK